jgi:DNA-binding GntR family transcriptional regulator
LELIEAKDVEAAAELMAAHKEYSRQAFLIAFDNMSDS